MGSTTITQNVADGGTGGAGLGGGCYNDAGSSLTLTASTVTKNEANGAVGIGGGVYNLGSFTFDAAIKEHLPTQGQRIAGQIGLGIQGSLVLEIVE